MTEAVVLRFSYAPHAGHAPAFVARDRGFFTAQGLRLESVGGLPERLEIAEFFRRDIPVG